MELESKHDDKEGSNLHLRSVRSSLATGDGQAPSTVRSVQVGSLESQAAEAGTESQVAQLVYCRFCQTRYPRIGNCPSCGRDEWALLSNQQMKAHREVYKAIQAGTLKRQPCQVCGSTSNIEAHHPDYSKPLEVEWVCRKHHRAIEHGNQKAKIGRAAK
jgi:hypothetical protein